MNLDIKLNKLEKVLLATAIIGESIGIVGYINNNFNLTYGGFGIFLLPALIAIGDYSSVFRQQNNENGRIPQ